MKAPTLNFLLNLNILLMSLCAMGDTKPSHKIYEAEDAKRNQLTVKNNHLGFSGKGFVEGFYNNANGLLTFTVQAKKTGPQYITVRYAAGFGNANIILGINKESQEFSMPSTGSWGEWRNVSIPVSLKQGTNTISFKMKFLQPMQTTDVWVQGTDRSGNFFKVALPLTLKVAGNEPLVFESKINQKVLGFYDESMLNDVVSGWTGSQQDVSDLAKILGIPDEQLPLWVTNLAVWVTEDKITMGDMIVSIEHLINN